MSPAATTTAATAYTAATLAATAFDTAITTF